MTARGRALTALAVLAIGLAAFLLLRSPRTGGPPAGEEAARPSGLEAAPSVLQPAGHPPNPEGPKPNASPSEPTIGKLVGQVVRASDGVGIPGARVAIHSATRDSVPAADTGLTGEDGRFELEVPTPSASGEALRVTAMSPGFETISLLLTGERGAPVQLRLFEGAVLSGRVVDDQGLPVAHATVFAAEPRNRFAWPFTDAFLPVAAESGGGRAVTAADGSFRIAGLRAGSLHLVSAHKTGFSSTDDEREVKARPGESGVTIVLRPTCRVLVRLVDAQSRETIRAHVARMTVSLGWQQLGTTARQALVRGDDLDAFAPGASAGLRLYLVRVATPGGDVPDANGKVTYRVSSPGYEDTSVDVPLEPGAVVSREVVLVRTAGMRTRVQLRAVFEGGLPFSGWLAVSFSGPPGKFPSGAEMRFSEGRADRAIDLPAGMWNLSPVGLGQTGRWWQPAGPTQALDLRKAPAEHTAELLLRGARLDLTVIDSAGRIYPTFDIQLSQGQHPGGWWTEWGSPEKDTTTGLLTPPPSHVWCPATATGIYVSVPGVGGAEVALPALPTDGTAVPLQLKLEAGKAIDWDAIRRQIYGGSPSK